MPSYEIYTAPQSVVTATTITEAQNLLKSLCSTIFATRDLGDVDKKIGDASKLRFGLMALLQPETSTLAYNQIIEGMNFMLTAYNAQVVPTVS